MEDYNRCMDRIRTYMPSYNSSLCNSFDMDLNNYTYNRNLSPLQKYRSSCFNRNRFCDICNCFCHIHCCPRNCSPINYSTILNNNNFYKNDNSERLNQLACEKMSLENLNKSLQNQVDLYSKLDNDVMKENNALKGMLNKSVGVFKAVEEKSQLPQNRVNGNNINYYLDKPREFDNLMNSQSNWIKGNNYNNNYDDGSLSTTLKNDNYSNNPFGTGFNSNLYNLPLDDQLKKNNLTYTFNNPLQGDFNNNDKLNSNNYTPYYNTSSYFGNSNSNNPFNDNLNKSNKDLQDELDKKNKENEQLKNLLNSSIPVFKAVELNSNSPNNKFNGDNIDYYFYF